MSYFYETYQEFIVLLINKQAMNEDDVLRGAETAHMIL